MRKTLKVMICSTLACSTCRCPQTSRTKRSPALTPPRPCSTKSWRPPTRDPHRICCDKAYCVAIIPGAKRAGFIFGGKYGQGCHHLQDGQRLERPSTIRIEGGSFGLQIGAGETDVVMVVMNKSGADQLMSSKFTLGGEAAGMAGPVGRATQAETDAAMKAKILTYSRARGVFGGLTLDGSTLRPDNGDNQKIYGKEVEHKTILTGGVPVPLAAKPLLADIRKYSGWPATATKKASTTKTAAPKK